MADVMCVRSSTMLTRVTFVTCCLLAWIAAVTGEELVNGMNMDMIANTTGFDKDTAKRFMYHSYAAYCLPKTILEWRCHWCKEYAYHSFIIHHQPRENE
jgi:hypothetical protein